MTGRETDRAYYARRIGRTIDRAARRVNRRVAALSARGDAPWREDRPCAEAWRLLGALYAAEDQARQDREA